MIPGTGEGVSSDGIESLPRETDWQCRIESFEKTWLKMKGIEFAFLALGTVEGAIVRYKMAESPLVLGMLPLNILVINVVGSFILGAFSILLLVWNLDARFSLLVAIGFCGSLQQCLHSLLRLPR